MNYYFAYGSNMSYEQMKERCPDSKYVGVARLNGYKLDFTKMSTLRGGNTMRTYSHNTTVVNL